MWECGFAGELNPRVCAGITPQRNCDGIHHRTGYLSDRALYHGHGFFISVSDPSREHKRQTEISAADGPVDFFIIPR